VAKIRHFAIKNKVPSNLWSRELSGKIPPKNHQISRKKVMKTSRFWRI
jgi:hypothetical protein